MGRDGCSERCSMMGGIDGNTEVAPWSYESVNRGVSGRASQQCW